MPPFRASFNTLRFYNSAYKIVLHSISLDLQNKCISRRRLLSEAVLAYYHPSFYASNDSDMVIHNMSIATADVPYVAEGPNVQYEAQADKEVRISIDKLCESY